jgi:hypothetical protein
MNVVTAKATYYVKKTGNVYGMFLGSRSVRYSQLAVHYVWKVEDEYRVYSPLRNKIKDHYKKVGRSSNEISEMLYTLTYGEFKDGFRAINLIDLDDEGLVKEMLKLKEEEFVLWLRTKKGMTLTEVTHFDIDVSKISEEDQGITDFHGAKVLFSATLKEKKKEEILGFIDTVRLRLESHGFGYLFPGNIVIAPLAKNSAGWYFQSSKEMHIDPHASKEVVEVLYHEYAHKLHHLFLNGSQKVHIVTTFKKEIRNVSTKEDERQHFKKIFHPGQKVQYIGDKFTQYHGKTLKIKTLGPTYLNIDTGLTTLTIPWANVHNNVKIEDGTKVMPFVPTKKSSMFPSEYSKTDSEEWFAECFAYYLMDKASPEINKFMQEVLASGKAQSSTAIQWEEVWNSWKKFHTGEVSDGTPELKVRVQKYGPYTLQEVNIKDIDIDFSKPLNSSEDEQWAAEKYAPLKTKAPPVILYKKKSGGYGLIDGRHRSRAAFLRGESKILAYVGVDNG